MKNNLLLYLFVIMEDVFIMKSKSGHRRTILRTKDAFNGKADDLHVNHATRE